MLVLFLYPVLTDAEEFAELMDEINVPEDHPFAEIYVGGLFPESSSGSAGGYFWWRVKL